LSETAPTRKAKSPARPTAAQIDWLSRGLDQPGGKLPLFDRDGQTVEPRLIRGCMAAGWAEPWFHNPLKPDWLVCRLTEAGRSALAKATPAKTAPAETGRS
jgi:hypothetical protein